MREREACRSSLMPGSAFMLSRGCRAAAGLWVADASGSAVLTAAAASARSSADGGTACCMTESMKAKRFSCCTEGSGTGAAQAKARSVVNHITDPSSIAPAAERAVAQDVHRMKHAAHAVAPNENAST